MLAQFGFVPPRLLARGPIEVPSQLGDISLRVNTAMPRVSRSDRFLNGVPVLAIAAQGIQEQLVLVICPNPPVLADFGEGVRDVGLSLH